MAACPRQRSLTARSWCHLRIPCFSQVFLPLKYSPRAPTSNFPLLFSRGAPSLYSPCYLKRGKFCVIQGREVLLKQCCSISHPQFFLTKTLLNHSHRAPTLEPIFYLLNPFLLQLRKDVNLYIRRLASWGIAVLYIDGS